MRSTKTVLRNLNSKKGACEMREKSQVEDIDRSIYDIRDEEKDAYRMKEGLTPQIVEQLSKEKAYEMSRVYLKTHDVTGSEGFLRCARHFFAGILTYFKEK